MIGIDSVEVVKLRELISNKKKYLQKLQPGTAAQFLQKEIMLLEKDILPIVEAETNILHYECTKYFIRACDAAFKLKCNGLLVYLPIHDQFENEPRVGIVNPREFLPIGSPGALSVSLDSMELNRIEYKTENLILNALIS
jgi:hypothetical protein